MKRPIPVSNQKIRDWNLFLTYLNDKGNAELPKDNQGNVRWDVLDKSDAFEGYKGGQDFYKKKFSEFSQQNLTGTGHLTEADFPVMQKLYQDMFTNADPQYKEKFLKPTLDRQGVDINTFNPVLTTTDKDNREGWIGSVSRNFFIPQDVHEGIGGAQTGQKNFLEAIFPSSFNQGEPFYKQNPGGVGVRYFEDGGKMEYEDGNEMESNEVEGVDGGKLDKVSEDVYKVDGPNHDDGGVDIKTDAENAEVEGGEVMHVKAKDGIIRVISIKRVNPETGNPFAEDYQAAAEEKAKYENSPYDWGKQRALDADARMDHIWDMHEKTRNKTEESDGKFPEGGPIYLHNKKNNKIITINDQEQAKKFKEKLGEGNYTEYTGASPEGYSSNERFFSKNGEFAKFSPKFQGQVESSEAYKGATELFPVSTGQKKNQPIDISAGTSTGFSTTGTVPVGFSVSDAGGFNREMSSSWNEADPEREKKMHEFLEKEVDKFGGYDLVIHSKTGAFNREMQDLERMGGSKNDGDHSIEKLYSLKNGQGTIDYDNMVSVAWDMRKKDNAIIGDVMIGALRPMEDKIIADYQHRKFMNGETGVPLPHEQIGSFKEFRDIIDNTMAGKIKMPDGREIDFGNMGSGQKEEIRNYIILNYTVKKNLEKSIDYANYIISDPEARVERYQIQKYSGIDPSTLKPAEEWVKILEGFTADSENLASKYSQLLTKVPLSINVDQTIITADMNNEVNDLNESFVDYLSGYKIKLDEQVKEGLDPEAASQMYAQEYAKIKDQYESQTTQVFNKYNRKVNQIAQKKIDLAAAELKGEWEKEIVALTEKYGIKDMTTQQILDNANNYVRLVQGVYSQKTSDQQIYLEQYAKENADFQSKTGDDWARISENLTKGTMQMFEMIGGGLKWLGAYEAGNILTDMMAEYNAGQPNMRIDWDGGAAMLDRDWWIERAAPMLPMAATLAATSFIPGAGAAELATFMGLQGIAKTAFTGVVGGAAGRFFESFLEGGGEFQAALDRGFDVQAAADRASKVARDNMWLIFLDAFQVGFAFSKIGKLSGLKSAMVKAPLEFATNAGEEIAQDYYKVRLDNPQMTFMQYATSPVGIETGVLGGIMGLGFTLPDIMSMNNSREYQNGVVTDALSKGSGDLQKRVTEFQSSADLLYARGMMDEQEWEAAKLKIDQVAGFLKDIPPSLSTQHKAVAVNILENIEAARTAANIPGVNESMKKFYEAQIKDGEKQLNEILTGNSPLYSIGSTSYTKDQFMEAITNPEIMENLVDQNAKISVVNDDEVMKMAEEAAAQFSINPAEKMQKMEQAKAGKLLFSEPVEDTANISAKYKESKGIKSTPGEKIAKLDEKKSMAIADAYEAMKHDPNNPEVKAAYQAMADETVQQFKAMKDAGYEVELYQGEGEPYKNSQEMLKDLRENKHLYTFSTEAGYGNAEITDEQRNENPLLAKTEFVDKNGKLLLINDLFRFVHDFFGHSERGNSFGPVGEENAWDVHARMYSPKARQAMTSETRGQNSWVNFGPQMRNKEGKLLKNGEPGYLDVTKRQFAEQKIGLLPMEFSSIGDEEVTEEGTPSKSKIQNVALSTGRASGKPGAKLFEKLKMGAPNITYNISTQKDFKKLKESNSVMFSKSDGTIYGAYDPTTGEVSVDIDAIKEGDAIEEFGHLWLNALEKQDPLMYNKALLAISEQPYYDQVANDPSYQDAPENILRNEALAKAIADRGLQIKKGNWFQDVWDSIKDVVRKIFGIHNTIDLNNFSLSKLIRGGAKELMTFKPWTTATSEEFLKGDTKITHRSIIYRPEPLDKVGIVEKTKRSLLTTYRNQMTQSRGTSPFAVALKEGYSASVEAEKNYITQFFKNISGPKLQKYLKKLSPQDLMKAERAMNGYLHSNDASFLVELDKDFQETLMEFRREIDKFSDRILDELDPTTYIATVDADLNLYLENNFQAVKEMKAAEWEKAHDDEVQEVVDSIQGLEGEDLHNKLQGHLNRINQNLEELNVHAKVLVIKQLNDQKAVLKERGTRPSQKLLKQLDEVIGNLEHNKYKGSPDGSVSVTAELYKNLNKITDELRQDLAEITDVMTPEEQETADLIADAINLLQADTTYNFDEADENMTRIMYNVVQDKLNAKGLIEKRIALSKYDNNVVVNIQSTRVEDAYSVTITHKDGTTQDFQDLSKNDLAILFGDARANEMEERDSNIKVPEEEQLIPTNNRLYQSITTNKGSYITTNYYSFEKPEYWKNNWRYELKKRFDENGRSLYDVAYNYMRKQVSDSSISGMSIQRKEKEVVFSVTNRYGVKGAFIKDGKIVDSIVLPIKATEGLSFEDLKESNGGFIDDVEFTNIMNLVGRTEKEIKFGTLADARSSDAGHYADFLQSAKKQYMFTMMVDDSVVDTHMESLAVRQSQANFLAGTAELSEFRGSNLKEKQDIPEEMRILMGEITDPVMSVEKTLLSQALAVQNMHFFNRMAKENGLFTDKPKGMLSGYVMSEAEFRKVHGEETTPETVGMVEVTGDELFFAGQKQRGPIYMTKEAHDLLIPDPQKSAGAMLNLYYMISGIMGFNYTAGNLGGGPRNTLSSVGLYLRAGGINPFKPGKTISQPFMATAVIMSDFYQSKSALWTGSKMAFGTLMNAPAMVMHATGIAFNKKSLEELQAEKNKLIALGLISGNVELESFKELSEKNKFTSFLFGNKFSKTTGQYYGVSDDIGRVSTYYQNLTEMKEANKWAKENGKVTMSEEAIEVMAAEYAKQLFPTYSRLPELLQNISRVPVVGAKFARFQASIYVTSLNTFKIAADQIGSKNPVLVKAGIKKIGSFTAMTLLLPTIAAGMFAAFGWDRDKYAAWNRLQPKYRRNSIPLFLSKPGTSVKYIDLSYIDPSSSYHKVAMSMMNSKNIGSGILNASKSIVDPFVFNDIVSNVLGDIRANENAFGMPIYKEYEDDDESWFDMAAWKSFVYGSQRIIAPQLGTLERAKKSINYEKGSGGQEYTPGLFLLNIGVGVGARKEDYDKMFQSNFYDLKKKFSGMGELEGQHTKFVKTGGKKGITEKEYKSYAEPIFNKAVQYIVDYQELGADWKHIYGLLEDTGIGKGTKSEGGFNLKSLGFKFGWTGKVIGWEKPKGFVPKKVEED